MNKPFQPLHWIAILLILFVAISCKTDPKPQTGDKQSYDIGRDLETVVVRMEAEPDVLNPFQTARGYNTEVMAYIFQPLMEYDPKTLEYDAVLVEPGFGRENINSGPYAGGEKYTFTLKENARWTDGKPVTVEDYMFTLKAIANPFVKSPYKGVVRPVKQVDKSAENPKTFFVSTFPKYFNSLEISSNFPILPKHIYDPKGIMNNYTLADLHNFKEGDEGSDELKEFANDFSSEKYSRDINVIQGSGPYTIERWEPGQELVLLRNDNWWGNNGQLNNTSAKKFPKRISYRTIKDIPATIASIKAQEVDVAVLAPSRQSIDARENELINENYNTHDLKLVEMYWISFNLRKPVLKDKRVRRAIAHLTDVDQILSDMAMELGQRIKSPYHPSDPFFSNDLPFIEYSPEKAKLLLDEAGWKDSDGDGFRDKMIQGKQTQLQIEYLASSSSEFSKQIGLILKDRAAKVGVDIQTSFKDYSLVSALRNEGKFDMSSGGVRRSPADYDPYQRYHTESFSPNGSNIFGYGDAESDRLIDSIRFGSKANRMQAYKAFEEKLYIDQPAIYLYTPWRIMFVHKRFDTFASRRRPGYFMQHFNAAE